MNFLRIENGDSDEDVLEVSNNENDEEDELARWEREQIRKGISSQKVIKNFIKSLNIVLR